MGLWKTSIGHIIQCWRWILRSFDPFWDVHLQQVLFAYQARPHIYWEVIILHGLWVWSTPTDQNRTQYQVDAEDY